MDFFVWPRWPSNMAASYKTLEILKFLNCSYFAKIMTRKPKIGNLTNMAKLYDPFLESKKWYLLLRRFCGHMTSW